MAPRTTLARSEASLVNEGQSRPSPDVHEQLQLVTGTKMSLTHVGVYRTASSKSLQAQHSTLLNLLRKIKAFIARSHRYIPPRRKNHHHHHKKSTKFSDPIRTQNKEREHINFFENSFSYINMRNLPLLSDIPGLSDEQMTHTMRIYKKI